MTKNKLSTEPYKGVRDFYPEDYALQKFIFSTWRSVAEKAGYVEYEASILEPAELYKAKGADNEEILKEQIYAFKDRGEREVTLRPEMTPSLARMVAGRRRELGFPLRWYSIPNCFRYERPQRGRLREFWQLNVDLFGSKSLAADGEVIGVAYGIMRALGGSESDFVIKVGSRPAMNQVAKRAGLSSENTKKFFGLLDRRDKLSSVDFETGLRELGVQASAVSASDVPEDVAELIEKFNQAGIENIVYDPAIVRGFAYYTGIVFEVFDTHPQNNRALFGGGRYDNLTAMFDDEPLPGVGFGMGDVTIRDFLETRGLIPAYTPPTQVYVAVTDPTLAYEAQTLAGEMRRQGVNVAIDFGERKLGDQIKVAVKHAVPWLVVVGQNELQSGEFMVKNLGTGTQESMRREQLGEFFATLK